MKLLSQAILSFLLIASACCYAGPSSQHPGLLAAQYATSIRPTDFSAGPVVITEPGYYILTGDIIFKPASPNNVDSFGNPWNAALIILTDNVTLDLNTYSIQQNRTFSSSKFKLIQIGGTNPFNTSDTTVYAPDHITIKNGSLREAQGYGIYGKENSHINVYDLTIGSCDITGIFLQHLQCSTIKSVCISGSNLGAGNVYGIFLRDNNSTTPEWTTDSSGAGPSGVLLEDIKICDISTDSSLNTDDEIVDLLCRAENKLDISDITNLNNCVTASLQPLITALVAAVNNLLTLISAAKAAPGNTALIDSVVASKPAVNTAITNLLNAINALPTPLSAEDQALKEAVESLQTCMILICDLIDQANALSDGQRDFINGAETITAWHAYGIRIAVGSAIECKNCTVTGTTVLNTVTDITRATGISLDKCTGCLIRDSLANESSTNLGAAIGVSIATNSQSNRIINSSSTHHTSNDESYGFWLCQSHSQQFLNCQASSNTGVNQSKGFYLEQSDANRLEQCRSFYHNCALSAAGTPSQTIGFDSVGGECNIFDGCEAYNMTADTNYQNGSFDEDLIAAGFRLQSYPDGQPATRNERNSVIINSTSRCHEGSAGNSTGIYLNGAICSTIRKNIVATNRSLLTAGGIIGGNGYGIWDTATDTTSLIVENTSYANQTLNYKVAYSLENERLPVVNSTYGDMTSIYVASIWQNISLYANPGSTGCAAECTPNGEFT